MRKLSTVLAATSVAFAALAVLLWFGRETQRQRADALQLRVATLEAVPATMQPSQPPVPVQTVTTPAATPVPAHPAATAQQMGVEHFPAARERLLLRNPEYRAALLAARRLELRARRSHLMRALNLSPEQADVVVDYWAQRSLASEDPSQSMPGNLDEISADRKRIDASLRASEEKARSAIGDETFARLGEFDASLQSRYKVDLLRVRLAERGTALREDQIEPLVTALHAEQAQVRQELRQFIATLRWDAAHNAQSHALMQERQAELMRAANQRIHDNAGALLSPQQLPHLDDMLRRDLESQQASAAIERIQAEMKLSGQLAKSN